MLSAGSDDLPVLLVSGTNFNAAMALSWAQALARHRQVHVVDLPGQPGLSDEYRPAQNRVGWYGQALAQVLDAAGLDRVIVVGNSLGAAVALACDSSRIAGRVLVSPGGIVRLAVTPGLLRATMPWLMRPSADRTRTLLELFVPPGAAPPEREVEWMTLIARHCRTTLARHRCRHRCCGSEPRRRVRCRSANTTCSLPRPGWARRYDSTWVSKCGSARAWDTSRPTTE